MAGFGDRRFVPAPSDIAVRFWQLTLNGELLAHTAVTRVARVLAGFVIGVDPGDRDRPADGDVRGRCASSSIR